MIPQELQEYIEAHTSKEDSYLKQLARQTHLTELQPHMLSGHYQGVYLQQISIIKQPKYILEIGTYTGYSALCLAKGLQPDGELHTIEVNEELIDNTRKTFDESLYSKQIISYLGDAKEIINEFTMEFDLVFIDADKSYYSHYYDAIIDKVSKGGIILADNILWKGQVLTNEMSKKGKLLDEFNKKVANDDRVISCCLPFRDGLMQIVKK